MAVNNISNFIIADKEPKKSTSAEESRALVKHGRALLELTPDWRGGEEAQDKIENMLEALETTLANVDGRLIMGILGGTGVGKSTLISALAGEEISKASAIRPTTSLPVIYRHESFPPLNKFSGVEIIHNINKLRGLAIVDFPDFDSLENKHHRLVLEHLHEIDLVLWLSDYNKYADRRFFELMHKARQLAGSASQVAALNKADQLLSNKEDKSEILEEILKDFSGLLKEFGHWDGPSPWAISAAESLAKPGERSAGGLASLRDLLDSMADAKIRRAIEMGNLKARNSHLKETVLNQAQPEQWLKKLNDLTKLKADFQLANAIEGDLAALNLLKPLYLAPRIERIKRSAKGLLSIFTDAWAFISSPWRGANDLLILKPAPPPTAPSFVQNILGYSEDFSFICNTEEKIDPQALAKKSEIILEKSLQGYYLAKDPKPRAWLLTAWPFILAILLVWAESGGQFGGPTVLTAAAIRSVAPWLIFTILGCVVLTNFTWFRVRRRLEYFFQKALDQAQADLLNLANETLSNKIEEAASHQTQSLLRLKEFENLGNRL